MAAAGQAPEGGCGDAGRRGSQTQARLAAAALPAADVGAGDAEDAGDAVVVGIETCIMQGVVTERISKVEEEVRYSCARFRKDARLGADLICNYFSLSGLEVNTFFFTVPKETWTLRLGRMLFSYQPMHAGNFYWLKITYK